MRKTFLTLIIAMTTLTIVNAQKIESEKVFGGYQYTQGGNRMTMGDLVNAVESNSESFKLMKKAKSSTTFASILSGAGGALIGFPIGTAIGGGEANWTLAGIGAGLFIVAIPIASSANKKTKNAIDLYNSNLTARYEFKPEFKILANGNGLGLSMNF